MGSQIERGSDEEGKYSAKQVRRECDWRRANA